MSYSENAVFGFGVIPDNQEDWDIYPDDGPQIQDEKDLEIDQVCGDIAGNEASAIFIKKTFVSANASYEYLTLPVNPDVEGMTARLNAVLAKYGLTSTDGPRWILGTYYN